MSGPDPTTSQPLSRLDPRAAGYPDARVPGPGSPPGEKSFQDISARYRFVVDMLPVIPFYGYPDGSVEFFDDHIKTLLGYHRDEFTSRQLLWPEIVFQEDYPHAKAILLAAWKRDRTYLREYRVRSKDGEVVWLQERGRIICGADGRIHRIEGILWDVTEIVSTQQAIEANNARLFFMVYEYTMRNRTFTVLNQMAEKLQTCFAPHEAYPALTPFLAKLFPGLKGALFILDDHRQMMEAVLTWGGKLSGPSTFPPDVCWASQNGRSHFTAASGKGGGCLHPPEVSENSYFCVPLLVQGETSGVFHLQISAPSLNSGLFGDFSASISEEVKQLAITVSDHLSLALTNLRLRESLQNQAVRDPLTGLFNRRYMMETLEREIHRARRHSAAVGVIMIDLDHFRRFNNTFGHDAGDAVLQIIGQFLQNHIRQEDVACRYGGEEFTLILPGAALAVTQQRAEQLRRQAQDLELSHHGVQLGTITLSLGVAAFPDHGDTAESILKAADTALYDAKNNGRNRVAISLGAHKTPPPEV